MGEYIVAHDLGTSGDKATLFTSAGKLVKSCVVPYQVHFFGKNCAEQDPNEWWKAVCRATKGVLEGIKASDVAAISFSGQMQGCLMVNETGVPLRPSIIWADQRAVKEAALLEREVGFDEVYNITGHRLSPGYTIEKIMWIKENEPEIYKSAYKCLQSKDYILYKLTGAFVTDYSDASGTNGLDLAKLEWSDEILEASGISKDLLLELHHSTDIIGKVTAEAAKAAGLSQGTPVVCGGGDGPCAAVGAGCIQENEFYTTFGTSAWVAGVTGEKFLDDDKIFVCFANVISGKYMPCGAMQAAGSSYSYIGRLLEPDKSYPERNEMMKASPAGAKELLFLPYMLGERSPRWNEKTSGAFIGMKMHHTREDYIRAAIEGAAYNLNIILSSYRKYVNVDSMILTGGGAKGEVVCQILSDVFGARLCTPDHVEEATSIGAAMVAGVGAGIYDSFEAITRFLTFQKEFKPNEANREIYDKMKRIFDVAYRALEPVFEMF